MLNEMETNNLSVREFKVMIIRILKELSESNNTMKKDIETIKNNQASLASDSVD